MLRFNLGWRLSTGWWVSLILLVTACDRAPQAPAAGGGGDEIVQIHVVTPTAWWLRINGDGSGAYGHGAEGGPSATIPGGTFDAAEIARALELRLLDTGEMKTHFAVIVHRRKDRAIRSRYTTDTELIRPLFERARERRGGGEAEVKELDRLWEENPPIEMAGEDGPEVLFQGR